MSLGPYALKVALEGWLFKLDLVHLFFQLPGLSCGSLNLSLFCYGHFLPDATVTGLCDPEL